jgi:hypothetical protein
LERASRSGFVSSLQLPYSLLERGIENGILYASFRGVKYESKR